MSEATDRIVLFLAERRTGQILLNVDRGVICSAELKERLRTDGKGDTAVLLDTLEATGVASRTR